ncbi:MAG: winged helix-turn-helix domain-containing protein [Candidatus Parvarchaeota archaeon]
MKPLNILIYGSLVIAIIFTGTWIYILYSISEIKTLETAAPLRAEAQPTIDNQILLMNASSYIATVAWGALAAALAYKGIVRSVWSKSMFDYSVFKLLVKMRGSTTRMRILQTLEKPMNRQQLANELGLDWKAVDRHIELLLSYGLIKEADGENGRVKHYVLTNDGKHVLELLEKLSQLSTP